MDLSHSFAEVGSANRGFAVAQPVPEAGRVRRIGLDLVGLARKGVDHLDLSEYFLCS